MKGLLKKDVRMILRTSWPFFPVCVVFLGMSLLSEENLSFLALPVLISGILPVTALSYDERSHWLEFCGTLPVSRAQFVSAKYLLGLICMAAPVVVAGVLHRFAGQYPPAMLPGMLGGALGAGLLVSGFSMPMMFKLGVEKGRLWYYLMLVIIGGSAGFLSGLETKDLSLATGSGSIWLILLVGAGLYAASWLLSIRLYQNREF